jgi:hypothetical protein
MRRMLFAVLVVFSGSATAQPTFGVGVGGVGVGPGGDCQGVVQQIIHDWFDVRAIISKDSGLQRPSAGELQCVDPAYVRGAISQRAGASGLRCYKVQQVGVCCDPRLQACAAL